jgi:hypothetical protein
MSLKAKFADRAAELESMGPADPAKSGQGKARAATTVPGMLLAEVLGARQDKGRIAELEAKLAAFQGSLPTVRLKPSAVRLSAFANRHQTAFDPRDPEFARLVDDVRATNGNVQPIAVRRLKEPVGDVSHEVVFGSRRRAACELAGVDQVRDKPRRSGRGRIARTA